MLEIKLADVRVFQYLQNEDLEHLSTMAQVITRDAGEVLLARGDRPQGLFIIGKGSVGVFTADTKSPLVQLRPGDSIGEMSFLEALPASATIRAEESPTQLALFPSDSLNAAIASHPGFGQRLYQGIAIGLSQKLRRTNETVGEEIRRGRELLEAIGTDGKADDYQRRVATYSQDLMRILTECQSGIEDLIRRTPEKMGSLNEMAAKVSLAKKMHEELIPGVMQKTDLVRMYLDNVEGFLFNS